MITYSNRNVGKNIIKKWYTVDYDDNENDLAHAWEKRCGPPINKLALLDF